MFRFASILLCFLFAHNANAQPIQCEKFAQLHSELESKYVEKPIWKGKSKRGHIIIIYMGEHGGWTALMLKNNQMACPLDAGHSGSYAKRGKQT